MFLRLDPKPFGRAIGSVGAIITLVIGILGLLGFGGDTYQLMLRYSFADVALLGIILSLVVVYYCLYCCGALVAWFYNYFASKNS